VPQSGFVPCDSPRSDPRTPRHYYRRLRGLCQKEPASVRFGGS
jgi:hypothetical protein